MSFTSPRQNLEVPTSHCRYSYDPATQPLAPSSGYSPYHFNVALPSLPPTPDQPYIPLPGSSDPYPLMDHQPHRVSSQGVTSRPAFLYAELKPIVAPQPIPAHPGGLEPAPPSPSSSLSRAAVFVRITASLEGPLSLDITLSPSQKPGFLPVRDAVSSWTRKNVKRISQSQRCEIRVTGSVSPDAASRALLEIFPLMLDGRHVKVYFEPEVHGQQAFPKLCPAISRNRRLIPPCPKSLHWDGDFAAFDLVTSYYELRGLERLSLALTSPATQIQCFSIFERFTMLKSCSIDHIAPGDEDQLWGKREILPLLKRLKIRTSVSPMVLLLAIELPSLATLEVQVEKGCGTRALAGLQTGLTEARRNTGSILPEQELIVRSCDWDEQHVGEALWREFNQLCDIPRPSSASNDSSLTWLLNAHN